MYQITRKYYNSLQNVKTIYYTFSDNITTPYLLREDILYIKGKETYLPGILDKTIKAFIYSYKYLDIDSYDYIVRTNISTIVNFNLLRHNLKLNNLDYGGSLKLTLAWLDKASGIVDKRYWGLDYISGTAIIFSNKFFKKMVRDILYNNKKVNYSVIDDVSIGLFVRDNYPDIKLISMDNLYTDNKPYNRHTVFYRNKNENRDNDIINMNQIVSQLLLSKNK
jgi:hypothetical protein